MCSFEGEEDIPEVFSWGVVSIFAIIIIRKVLLEAISTLACILVLFAQLHTLKSGYLNLE
jgi:hypothetical protein